MVTKAQFEKMSNTIKDTLNKLGDDLVLTEEQRHQFEEAKNRTFGFIIHFHIAFNENEELKKALAVLAQQVADFAERAGYLETKDDAIEKARASLADYNTLLAEAETNGNQQEEPGTLQQVREDLANYEGIQVRDEEEHDKEVEGHEGSRQ